MVSVPPNLTRILRRRPFAVLGYSAEDDTYCPRCLRFSAGLTPGRPDTNGRPVLPLYLRDPTMHEERCCACGERLLDLLPGLGSRTFRVQRRVTDPGSTVVRYVPVGVLLLHPDGRGVFYANLLDAPFHLFPADRPDRECHETVAAPRPPIVRRVARAPL